MDSGDVEYAQLLKRLTVRFADRTLAEIESMRELTSRLREGDAEVALQFERWAHKIHGSAASLGLHSVSEHGRRIERMAEAKSGDERRLDSEACEKVLEHMNQIEHEVRRLLFPETAR